MSARLFPLPGVSHPVLSPLANSCPFCGSNSSTVSPASPGSPPPLWSRRSDCSPVTHPPLELLSHCIREVGSPGCLLSLCCWNLWFTQVLDILPKYLDLQNLKISPNITCLPGVNSVIPVCIGRSSRSWAFGLARLMSVLTWLQL